MTNQLRAVAPRRRHARALAPRAQRALERRPPRHPRRSPLLGDQRHQPHAHRRRGRRRAHRRRHLLAAPQGLPRGPHPLPPRRAGAGVRRRWARGDVARGGRGLGAHRGRLPREELRRREVALARAQRELRRRPADLRRHRGDEGGPEGRGPGAHLARRRRPAGARRDDLRGPRTRLAGQGAGAAGRHALGAGAEPRPSRRGTSLAARRALLSAIDRDALAKLFEPEPVQVASGWRARLQCPVAAALHPEAEAALAALGLAGAHLTLHTGSLAVKDGAVGEGGREADGGLRARRPRGGGGGARRSSTRSCRRAGSRGWCSRAATPPIRRASSTCPSPAVTSTSSTSTARTFDEAMKSAYERFASSLYDERRAALEQGLQALWAERLPMLPLVLTSRLSAVRADLGRAEVGPLRFALLERRRLALRDRCTSPLSPCAPSAGFRQVTTRQVTT